MGVNKNHANKIIIHLLMIAKYKVFFEGWNYNSRHIRHIYYTACTLDTRKCEEEQVWKIRVLQQSIVR